MCSVDRTKKKLYKIQNAKIATYFFKESMSKYFRLFVSSIPFFGFQLASADGSSTPDSEQTPSLFYQSWCPVEVDVTLALDSYRGIFSGSWNNSFGALTAVNLTVPLPRSFSTQVAGSYGLYDWAGRSSTPFKNSSNFQQQGFITIAAAWQTPNPSGWNAGAAYDWMLNKNFGLFAVDPDFDQVRGQFGYLFKGGNELGAWGTYGIHSDHEKSQNVPLKFRGISQVNIFWNHHFKSHGYAMLWVGTPYRRGLRFEHGRAGRFIVGAQFSVPVTHSLSIDGHGSYMSPRGGSGVTPSKNYGANLCFGITYAFGKRRIDKTPYMTLANNSNFMADTNHNL